MVKLLLILIFLSFLVFLWLFRKKPGTGFGLVFLWAVMPFIPVMIAGIIALTCGARLD